MATINPRINITVSDEIQYTLNKLAKKLSKPVAAVARDLLESALERHEDTIWAQMADERARTATKYLTHEEFWAQVLPESPKDSKAKR